MHNNSISTKLNGKRPRILLVDDQSNERSTLANALQHDGFDVRESTCESSFVGKGDSAIDAVVSSLRPHDRKAGIRFVQSWRRNCPQTPVIAIAGDDQMEPAIEAMRIGAADCLSRPVHPRRLSASLRRILSIRRDKIEADAGDFTGLGQHTFEGMIGASEVMRRVFAHTELVAPTNATVLITGATGTGKDLLAQAIHHLSRRSAAPLVTINAAAVPATLLESELFGHVKGAFTDAASDRVGRFEAAEGGTLFIDEIGDLKLASQAKLLRALESRVINRVGSNDDIAVDVRILAATSRDLERLVTEGQFREDLYYRLNVLRIELPELRQRRDDIPLLVDRFLETTARAEQQQKPVVDPELMKYLVRHSWPGNIRQLRNCLESMSVLSLDGHLTLEQLPPTIEGVSRSRELKELPLAGNSLDDLERVAIEQTVEQCAGNRSRAADTLGISIRTLQRKLKQWTSN